MANYVHVQYIVKFFCVYSGNGDAVAPDASTTTSATGTMENEVREVRSLLVSLKEAYEAQSAAMRDLQAQMKIIAVSQDAKMNSKRLRKLQKEKSAKNQKAATLADSGSDGFLQELGLVPQESHLGSRSSPPQSL